MNALCGISTLPTCFMRFFPSFCFSSSRAARGTADVLIVISRGIIQIGRRSQMPLATRLSAQPTSLHGGVPAMTFRAAVAAVLVTE